MIRLHLDSIFEEAKEEATFGGQILVEKDGPVARILPLMRPDFGQIQRLDLWSTVVRYDRMHLV